MSSVRGYCFSREIFCRHHETFLGHKFVAVCAFDRYQNSRNLFRGSTVRLVIRRAEVIDVTCDSKRQSRVTMVAAVGSQRHRPKVNIC